MGWSGGNEAFDPVARRARELGLSDEQVTELLTALICGLQDCDWDTEYDSLELFRHDEAVIEAFRRNDITLSCLESQKDGDVTRWCDRERGSAGHPDGQHEGEDGIKWPVKAAEGRVPQ